MEEGELGEGDYSAWLPQRGTQKGPLSTREGRDGQEGLASAQAGRLSQDVHQGGLRCRGSLKHGNRRTRASSKGETRGTGASAKGKQGGGQELSGPSCRRR